MTKKFLMVVLTALTGLTFAVPPVRAQEAAVELYKDYNFRGGVLRLDSPGYHALPRDFNDEVSSIIIPSGFTVTIYEDRNQAGRSVKLGAGRHNVSDFNDAISSLVIKRTEAAPNDYGGKPVVELFEDYDFGGQRLRVDNLGYYTVPGYFNDRISSLIVPEGYEVTLYENYERGGRNIKLGAGRHNITRFNDTVSSLVINRVGGDPNDNSGKSGVEFFQDYDFGGQRLRVNSLGYYPMPSYFNDQLSSLIVTEGYEVTLYEDYNQAGRSIKLGAGRHNISRFNDTVSSVVVKRVGETTPSTPNQKEVHLYDDLNYRGDRIVIDKIGYHAFPPYFNDRISSLIVPKGYVVTLYENYDRGGRSIILREGRHNLDDFSNIVSSLVVRNADEVSNPGNEPIPGRREVQLYDDMNFRGDRIVVDKTGYFAFPRYFDNRLSSLIVPKGYEVALFDNSNQGGNSIVLQPGRHNLSNFNDVASSIVVRRIGEDNSPPSNPQTALLKERIERQFVGRRVEQVVRQLRFAGYRPSIDRQGQVTFNLANLDSSYRVTLNYNPQSNLVESVDVR